jgi:hypothetical protein
MSWKRIFFDNPVTLLDQYSEYVQEDRLERTEYGIWRNLKKYFMSAEIEDCQVGFEYDDLGNILIGKSKRDVGNYDPLILEGVHINDGRFGTFIANFLDEVDKPWKTTGPIFVGHRESVKIYGSITAENLTAKTVDVSNSTIRAKASDGWKEIYNIDVNYNNNKERESNNMKFNFDFGSCENDNVRMSPYGIAIKNTDSTWVSYDAKSGNIIDVDIFNFDGGKYLFKMPVAVKDVKVGDTIIHQRTPVYVVEVKGTDITVIDPRAGDKKIILPTTNMFGFNFITKVVSLLDGAFGTPTNDNPFGSMLPFFLMSNSDKKGNDIDPLMMAMLLNGGNAAGGFQNPMMLALMCADQTNMRDVLPLMMLAGQGNTLAAPAAN